MAGILLPSFSNFAADEICTTETYLPQFERVGACGRRHQRLNSVDGVLCRTSMCLLEDLLATSGDSRAMWCQTAMRSAICGAPSWRPAAAAIKAGCNLCYGSEYNALGPAVQNDLVTEKEVDQAL